MEFGDVHGVRWRITRAISTKKSGNLLANTKILVFFRFCVSVEILKQLINNGISIAHLWVCGSLYIS